ncbi:MAG TPA: ABC transporter ATP-binding protein [Planctomycetes bacterium]|nr:ABC transporter ATP-binding protein [Planctomycetota bacterium]
MSDAAPAPGADPPEEAGLSASELTVRYRRDRPPVLEEQSIALPLGGISVFIGPNGSGKSTLLKALARQLSPEAGQVVLDGRDLASYSGRELALRLGILFQENSAPNDLSVEELTYHGRYPHRRLFESLTEADHEAVERALTLCGATHLRHRPISQISSGQKQLAWIAMLIAQSPRYLFLDEPTTYLDMAHQFDVMNLIERLNEELGCTIVISVHDINLAARYADHVFALREGRLVASGTPEEVLRVETLREVFEVETRMFRDEETGTLHCVPLGRSAPEVAQP